ncbi:MAG: MurR/RpiR family transcriptional regulator [Deltaproteobacteria bacterium]|nr:MurR/RpiR family transcriptional regulator [Deltaproteobacteria bacterium]
MTDMKQNPAMQKALKTSPSLTPKGKLLRRFILGNPRKAVFMTSKELAGACDVSEATVVRFVSQLGYQGYGAFRQALRDFVDRELTLLEREGISGGSEPGKERLHRVITEEIDNLLHAYEKIDPETLRRAIEKIRQSPTVYVVGSRVSYTYAYYLGWSLTKVREDIHILKGSDSATIDWMTIAPKGTLIIIIATSRYPNELVRLGKLARRLDLDLLVISDSSLCPITQFAHLSLIAPSKSIPFIGNPTAILCIINYLILELAGDDGRKIKAHQEKLEQVYREHDLLFNLRREDPGFE